MRGVEVVTILGTDRRLRDGEVRLAKYTEVSPMYTGAGLVELRVCVCVHMHACDCGYTGTGVCTYVGMCVHVPIYVFLLPPLLELSNSTLVRLGL